VKFSKYPLSREIKDNIEKLGWRKPTDIQYRCISVVMRGDDVLAIAQTGTGKTAAFAIPVIHGLQKGKIPGRRDGIRCLVMVPTRELAIQLADVFKSLAKKTKVKVFALYGGVDQDKQIKKLQDGVDILISTPGRMFDLISQGYLRTNRIHTLILDEADHMLALGLKNQASLKILKKSIGEHQELENELSFDPNTLRRILDGKRIKAKERMRKLLRDPAFAYRDIRDKDEYRLDILWKVKLLADQGVGGYAFPKEYGGGGMSGDHIAVFETLAYHDLSLTIKFGVQFGLFGGAVYMLGTSQHHKKYIAPLVKADLLGCFAMTETGHGSNVRGLETTATYNHDTKFITIQSPNLAAGKEYIGNAMHSSMAAVFAQLIVDGVSHGVHAILVPIRDEQGNILPGVTIKDCGYKMGLNGVDNGRLWFDRVSVPVENLLNKYGNIDKQGKYNSQIDNPNKRFFTMLGALVAGRVCVGLAGLSATKSALTIAIRYGLERRQFDTGDGGPEQLLLDYPTHQKRLLPRLAKTYAYSIALSQLAEDYVYADESQIRKIETKAAGLKAMATWHTTDTIQECREACGGKGYLAENRISFLKADSDIFTTFEGDNTVLMQLVAKGLLTEFKQSFHSEGTTAVIKYLRSRIMNTVAEYNPIYKRMTSVDHLMDKDFHNHALRYREKKILLSISKRMQKYLKRRIKPSEVFLKVQVHMMDLAKAYIERLTYKEFIKKMDSLEDSNEKNMLLKLSQLFALTVIEEDKGWYLEADYLEGVKTKAIRRMINKLCQELRYEASGLVVAFGIPEELLGAKVVV